jgi:hypothetical protein
VREGNYTHEEKNSACPFCNYVVKPMPGGTGFKLSFKSSGAEMEWWWVEEEYFRLRWGNVI